MAVAASTPITVVTLFDPSDGRWTWAAYREQMLLLRSRPRFCSQEDASEAGRLAAIDIRRRLHVVTARY